MIADKAPRHDCADTDADGLHKTEKDHRAQRVDKNQQDAGAHEDGEPPQEHWAPPDAVGDQPEQRLTHGEANHVNREQVLQVADAAIQRNTQHGYQRHHDGDAKGREAADGRQQPTRHAQSGWIQVGVSQNVIT